MADQDARQVEVVLHLQGGHQHTVYLPAESELLQDLCSAVVADATGEPPKIFQLPADGGTMAYSFSSRQLVSMTTRPPVVIQVETLPEERAEAAPFTQPLPDGDRPARWLEVGDFLSSAEHAAVLQWACDHESQFERGGTTTNEYGSRTNLANYRFHRTELARLLIHRVLVYLPAALRRLGLEPFPLDDIEAQMTASNDGHYFKAHLDGGSDSTRGRRLTWVYYLHADPKAYSGGELRFFDSRIVHGQRHLVPDAFVDIEPDDNSLLVFPSDQYHELRPVGCPSKAFADSRFAVTGWIRARPRAAATARFGWGDFEGALADLKLAVDA